MNELYSFLLFLHVAGALGLFAALALEWAGVLGLRRAVSADQVRPWTGLLSAVRRVGGPSMGTILLTGIYMTATRWGGAGWIVVGLAGLIGMGALGGGLSGRRLAGIAAAASNGSGTVSGTLGDRIRDPVLTVSLWLRTALGLGVVYIMTAKPPATVALAVLVTATLVGLGIGLRVGAADFRWGPSPSDGRAP